MRILIHGINYSPELVGIGKYTTELAVFLVGQGHQVHVVTAPPYYPDWQIHPGYSAWKYTHEILAGVSVYRCPIWVSKNPSGMARVFHLASFAIASAPVVLAQAAWKPDIVLSIAPAIASAPFAWMAAWLSKCHAWLHIQDFELETAINLEMLPGAHQASGSRLLPDLMRRMEAWLLKRFDRVSTISPRMIDLLQHKGVPASKIYLLPNWVDCQVIYPLAEPSPYRAEWGLQSDQVVVLYSGSMGQKQGLELLIQAARIMQAENSNMPGKRMLFVLCGEGSARQELQQEAIGLSNVIFIPLQPEARLNELLNSAEIHVLLQRAGAADRVMPSKLTGMLASGKPVVATANHGTELARVVEEVGLLVPSDDLDGLCAALLRLVDQPALRSELGMKGRLYAQAHWDKKSVLSNLITQLNHLQV